MKGLGAVGSLMACARICEPLSNVIDGALSATSSGLRYDVLPFPRSRVSMTAVASSVIEPLAEMVIPCASLLDIAITCAIV